MLHARDLMANTGEIARRFAADRRRRQQRRALDAADIGLLKEAGLNLAAIPQEHGSCLSAPSRQTLFAWLRFPDDY